LRRAQTDAEGRWLTLHASRLDLKIAQNQFKTSTRKAVQPLWKRIFHLAHAPERSAMQARCATTTVGQLGKPGSNDAPSPACPENTCGRRAGLRFGCLPIFSVINAMT
jgi:hypothetical protein